MQRVCPATEAACHPARHRRTAALALAQTDPPARRARPAGGQDGRFRRLVDARAVPGGILAEHRAVRTAAGVFDISHMGQFIVGGPGAKAWLDSLFSNNLQRIGAGKSQYGFPAQRARRRHRRPNRLRIRAGRVPAGGQRVEDRRRFRLARRPIRPRRTPTGEVRIEISNRSDRFAALAVQGPRSPEVYAAFFGPGAPLPERFGVCVIEREGLTFLVARTGYTGEDGFEWFFPARASEVVWDELLAVGAPLGLIPCGLGCARQPAAGGVLPAQRLRPLARTHTAGGRAWASSLTWKNRAASSAWTRSGPPKPRAAPPNASPPSA